MEPLISVIVPVYKVEKYLDKCVSSIVNQTYKNLEIILVDDGSPDDCPKMCDDWAKKDNRIKVIHKDNGGVSSARNKGLDIAQGEYIGFVDADDYIAEDMYEFLYNLIIKYDSDIARCTFTFIYADLGGELLDAEVCDEEKVYELDELYNEPLNKGTKPCITCNKLFKKEIIENVRYNTNLIKSEDLLFTYFATKNAKRMATHDIPKYYYLKHNYERTDIDNFELLSYHAFIEILNNENLDMTIYRCFVRLRMALYERVLKHDKINFNIIRKEILRYYDKIHSSYFVKRDRRVLLKLFLLKNTPKLYYYLVLFISLFRSSEY